MLIKTHVKKIKILGISENSLFSISILLFLLYCFIPAVRSLSLYVVQIPLITISYVALLLSVASRGGKKAVARVFTVSLLILVFTVLFFQGIVFTISTSTLIGIYFSLFIVTIPFIYVYSRELEFVNYESLYLFIMILVIITCITTIIGTYQYPSPCRQISGNANAELNKLYSSKNIGGYRFIYFLLLCIPYMIKRLQLRRSLFDLLVLLLSSFCILRSDFTTAIILWLIVLAFSIALKNSKVITIILIGISSVLLFVFFDDFLVWIAGKTTSFSLNNRINSLLLYMQGGFSEGDLLIRKDLYSPSLQVFLHNPIGGEFFSFDGQSGGGHSQILDFLAHSGLIGLVFLFAFIHGISKWPSLRLIESDGFRKLQLCLALVIASINTFLAPELFFAILVIPLLQTKVSK